METTENKKNGFFSINVHDFFSDLLPKNGNLSEQNIIVFTPNQNKLINAVLEKLKGFDNEHYNRIVNRINDLKSLVASFENFPSLLEKHELTAELRTPQSLIQSLLSNKDLGEQSLNLPSKATLGKGFLIAKMHTFASLQKLAERIPEISEFSEEFHSETVSMMFLLLAEDVYLNLIWDSSIPTEFRTHLCKQLLLLWEHRNDQTIHDIAPVLQTVWNARQKLAPAFGTMMGTSELLLMSMQMDSLWIRFIKERLGDSHVSQAMEEFLFGISYEQIQVLRSMLKEKGIKAIGRDEVSTYLGEDVAIYLNHDYRDFYTMYTVRRDNARARSRMHLEGPHKTLEDYFIQFKMEVDREIAEDAAFE